MESQLGCLQKRLRSSRCQYCVTQRHTGDSIDAVLVVRSNVLSGLVSPILPVISKLTLSLKKIKWKKTKQKPYRSLLIQHYAKDATRHLQPQPGSLQIAKGNHQDPHRLSLQNRLQKHTLKKKKKKEENFFFLIWKKLKFEKQSKKKTCVLTWFACRWATWSRHGCHP